MDMLLGFLFVIIFWLDDVIEEEEKTMLKKGSTLIILNQAITLFSLIFIMLVCFTMNEYGARSWKWRKVKVPINAECGCFLAIELGICQLMKRWADSTGLQCAFPGTFCSSS